MTKSIRLLLATVFLFSGPVSQLQAQEQWKHTLVPLYLWATGVGGDAQLGPVGAPVDLEFKDAVEHLDAAFSFHYEANKGQWGMLADVYFMSLSPESVLPNGAKVGVDLDNTIYELGGVYRPEAGNGLELLFGLRMMDLELGGSIGSNRQATLVDESWTDAFVGLRKRIALGESTGLTVRGDVGAGDSDLVWNASLLLDYRFNQTVSMFGGYRWLGYDIETGSGRDHFAYDVTYQGPAVALRFDW